MGLDVNKPLNESAKISYFHILLKNVR